MHLKDRQERKRAQAIQLFDPSLETPSRRRSDIRKEGRARKAFEADFRSRTLRKRHASSLCFTARWTRNPALRCEWAQRLQLHTRGSNAEQELVEHRRHIRRAVRHGQM